MRRLAPILALIVSGGCAPPVPVLPAPDGESAVEAAQRWTVEVHSGEDLARAEEIASSARLRFDDPVTVVAVGGNHHVRIGAFRTRQEADDLASVARERGYRSAHVVAIGPGEPSRP